VTPNQLILDNKGFAYSIALEYVNKPGQRAPREDLIAGALLGLCKAASMFNPTKGFRFITYAAKAIRREVLEVVYQNLAPVYIPRRERWGTGLGLSFKYLDHTPNDWREEKNTPRQLTVKESVTKILDQKDTSRWVRREVQRLSPRERDILIQRFGLRGTPMTLEQVSNRLSIGKERVRQVQKGALEKLRKRMEGR